MKHALIAASLVLVAGLGAGCSGGDDTEPEASAETSASEPATEGEFCEAYTSLARQFEGQQPPNEKAAVEAIRQWGDDLTEVGPPEEIPADARKGYDLLVGTVAQLEEGAGQEDIERLTKAYTKAQQTSSNAFGDWVTETCPLQPPSGSPSEDSSSPAP
jgi:hypothetical protein